MKTLDTLTATSPGRNNSLRHHLLYAGYTLLLFVFLPLLLSAADILPEFSEKYIAAAEKKYGSGARTRMQAWERLISENRNKPEMEKLQIVNDFANKTPYMLDKKQWGIENYWATPAQFVASNNGDCKAYAIAKYFTLVAMGVDSSKLKITYVRATREAHMVLAYYPQPDAVPLILDNLIPYIKPASQRPDLKPIYSFNGDGLWLVKSQTENRVGNSSNIRFWREMRNRMGKEF